jgi:soluble lytic murein transglycosylase
MKIFKIVLGLFLVSLFILFSYLIFNVNKALKFYPIIEQYSLQYNVDPLLVTSIMKVESNFNPNARSKKGAIGLMQLMPQTAKEVAIKYLNLENYNEKELYNPDLNIALGVYYVKILSDMFNNNTNLVLASYNAGLGNVQIWKMKNPIIEYDPEEMPFKETKNYVSKINKFYKCLKIVSKVTHKI